MTTTDEKKYSERELILAKREAWVECDREFVGENSSWLAESQRMAAKRYPMPKVKRPRVVTDPLDYHVKWRVSDDRIVGDWTDKNVGYSVNDGHSAFAPYQSRVKVWADLLANPTEEVDADD